jgi:hypothetical protein
MLFEEDLRLGQNDGLACRMHVEDPDALTVGSPDSFVHLHARRILEWHSDYLKPLRRLGVMSFRGVSTQFGGDRYELLLRVDLKFFG